MMPSHLHAGDLGWVAGWDTARDLRASADAATHAKHTHAQNHGNMANPRASPCAGASQLHAEHLLPAPTRRASRGAKKNILETQPFQPAPRNGLDQR